MSIFGCICMIVLHKSRCTRPVKFICNECNARLCSPCARQHHQHKDVRPIEEKKTK